MTVVGPVCSGGFRTPYRSFVLMGSSVLYFVMTYIRVYAVCPKFG